MQTHGKVKVPLQVAEGARRHRDGDARARLDRQRARRRVEQNTEALELLEFGRLLRLEPAPTCAPPRCR